MDALCMHNEALRTLLVQQKVEAACALSITAMPLAFRPAGVECHRRVGRRTKNLAKLLAAFQVRAFGRGPRQLDGIHYESDFLAGQHIRLSLDLILSRRCHILKVGLCRDEHKR